MIHITDKNIDFETAIVLGNFDGIHVGHQKLIETAKKYSSAHNLALTVLSFNPHPASVLINPAFLQILTSEEKAFLFEEIGVKCFIEYKFDRQLASTSPESFITDILLDKFKCRALFVGESFRFGKDNTGDGVLLKDIAKRLQIEVDIIPEMYVNTEKVSSSLIRKLIAGNELTQANRLLGRPFFLMGEVIHGNKLGRTLGFPTANMRIPGGKLLPKNGVFLSQTHLDGKILPGVTNVGIKPTVSDKPERVAETFLFDFNENIYSKKIRVDFLDWIRDETMFSGIEELKKQISFDEQTARKMVKHFFPDQNKPTLP